MSIAALLCWSTTILSTVDCSVADNDVDTIGETVHGLTEKDLVSNSRQHKHPESLCSLNVNFRDDFTAGGLCPSMFSNNMRSSLKHLELMIASANNLWLSWNGPAVTPVKDQWRGASFGTFNHEFPQRCLGNRHWQLVAFKRAAARQPPNL